MSVEDCPSWEDHEWEKQPNGYNHCTKCSFEKTDAELDYMKAARDVDLSHGFDAGNYSNAYESHNFSVSQLKREVKDKSQAFATGFILGFFSSYELHEIPEDHRESFIGFYKSRLGQRVLELGYCDAREL